MTQTILQRGAALSALLFSTMAYGQLPTLVKDVENPAHTAFKVSKGISFVGAGTSVSQDIDFGTPGKTSIITSINMKCVFNGDTSLHIVGPILAEKVAGNTFVLFDGQVSPAEVNGDTVRQWLFAGGMYTPVAPAAPFQAPILTVAFGRTGKNLAQSNGACTVVVAGFVVP